MHTFIHNQDLTCWAAAIEVATHVSTPTTNDERNSSGKRNISRVGATMLTTRTTRIPRGHNDDGGVVLGLVSERLSNDVSLTLCTFRNIKCVWIFSQEFLYDTL